MNYLCCCGVTASINKHHRCGADAAEDAADTAVLVELRATIVAAYVGQFGAEPTSADVDAMSHAYLVDSDRAFWASRGAS